MTPKDKKIIEDAEAQGIPIFVLTAKDIVSVSTLVEYSNLCMGAACSQEHINGIDKRIVEFENWQENNPEKVKIPD